MGVSFLSPLPGLNILLDAFPRCRCGLLSCATPWLNLRQDETNNLHAHRGEASGDLLARD